MGQVTRENTLAEILAKNKKIKDEEFQEQWKLMKQGQITFLSFLI